MVLALHDQSKYETHILGLKPGHHYSVYVQAKQVKDTGNGSLVAYSAWQSVNKTTSKWQGLCRGGRGNSGKRTYDFMLI